jgi:2-aminoadipate transaminase
MQSSTIRELLKLTARADVINLAGGLPAAKLFPMEEVRSGTDRALTRHGVRALQYGPTDGFPELRAQVAGMLPGAQPEQVIITSGSQQGLDLVSKILLDPGDLVAVAAPSYMGALRAFDPYEPEYLTVPSGADGIDLDALEAVLTQQPKFLYVIPDFDNPQGSCMPAAQRERLVEVARRHGVLLVEDSPYRELRFEGDAEPTLHSLDPSNVVHLGTLSKTLAPGLRVAWAVAPEPLKDWMERAKQASDLHTSTFTQAVALELLEDGILETRKPALRAHYREQCHYLANAVQQEMKGAFRFNLPAGGMFLWGELPAGNDAEAFFHTAVEHGVAFVPGAPFYANGGPSHTMRLSFAQPTEEELSEAARRLGQAWRAFQDAS